MGWGSQRILFHGYFHQPCVIVALMIGKIIVRGAIGDDGRTDRFH